MVAGKKSIFAVLSIAAMVRCSVPLETDRGEDGSQLLFLPLEVGRSWVLQTRAIASNGQPSRDTLAVFGTAVIGSQEYYLFGREHSPQYLRTDEAGRTISYHQGTEKVLFWASPDSGDTYQYPYRTGEAQAYTVTVEHDLLVETPAGVFVDCVRFTFDDPAARDDRLWYTLAPGVGIVARGTEQLGEWVLVSRSLPD